VETPLFKTMLAVRDIAEEAEAQIPAQDYDVQEHAKEEVATAVSTRRRKGVVIRDPEEELHIDTPAETPTPMKKKDHVEMDAEYAKKLQEELDKEHGEAYKNIDWNDAFDHVQIVKDRFSTKKPTNFLDEYLLLTLKTMFGELDEHDAILRNQKSVHGLALVKRWKLLTSCGVHVIILSTVQLFLLVERRYPLSRFTLEQLVNVAKLQVEEESEMSLELLRFTRQQLLEYQQG
nr:hypothetical protein [Tanacetum cinerariifolium]